MRYMCVPILAVFLLLSCSSAPDQVSSPAVPNPLSSYDSQVTPILDEMTLEEKIGQMVQAECTGLNDIEDVKTYFMGSVLSGGNGDPPTNSLQDWTDLYDNLQKKALETRLGIPILYGVDAVHGHNNVLDAVIFPHNVGLGCTRNPELVELVSEITAKEVRATGINWTFAPCVAVPQDDRWAELMRASVKIPLSPVNLAPRLYAVSRALISPILYASWPALNTSQAMVVLLGPCGIHSPAAQPVAGLTRATLK